MRAAPPCPRLDRALPFPAPLPPGSSNCRSLLRGDLPALSAVSGAQSRGRASPPSDTVLGAGPPAARTLSVRAGSGRPLRLQDRHGGRDNFLSPLLFRLRGRLTRGPSQDPRARRASPPAPPAPGGAPPREKRDIFSTLNSFPTALLLWQQPVQGEGAPAEAPARERPRCGPRLRGLKFREVGGGWPRGGAR